MYFSKDIVKLGDPILKQVSKDVSIPLSAEDKKVLAGLYEYVVASHIDKLVEQYQIRPGVGIAAVQVGVNKRMFAVHFTDFLDDDKLYSLAIVNPKIVNKSKEMTYLPGGEGCLSVDENTTGLTPRHYEITIKCYIYDFSKDSGRHVTMQLEGYPAIVFQHEYDHLDGIMFTDKLFKDLPNLEPLYEIDEESEDE